jgi:exopolysaccharide production protein ExoQ
VISVVSEIVLKSFQPFSSSWRFGGVLHPISQGLNCGLLALGSFALCKLSGKRSVVYFVIALVALCFLVMTKSRMAFASTIISIGVFWYYALPKSGKMASGLIGFVIFVFSILSVFVLLKFDLRNVIIGLASFGRGAEGKASIAQMTGRIPLWEECLSYAVDRPVLGYGYNAFFTADHITQITEVIGWVPSHCHSGYIETLVSLGFVGTISLVVMLLLSLKMSIRLAKSSSEYAFTAAMMVWLCSNMFLESFLISSTSFPSFICLTLVVKMGFWEKRLLGMENKERLAISY